MRNLKKVPEKMTAKAKAVLGIPDWTKNESYPFKKWDKWTADRHRWEFLRRDVCYRSDYSQRSTFSRNYCLYGYGLQEFLNPAISPLPENVQFSAPLLPCGGDIVKPRQFATYNGVSRKEALERSSPKYFEDIGIPEEKLKSDGARQKWLRNWDDTPSNLHEMILWIEFDMEKTFSSQIQLAEQNFNLLAKKARDFGYGITDERNRRLSADHAMNLLRVLDAFDAGNMPSRIANDLTRLGLEKGRKGFTGGITKDGIMQRLKNADACCTLARNTCPTARDYKVKKSNVT